MTFSDFFDALSDLDWVGILVATVAIAVLGALWYGPLFGKAWSSASGSPAMTGMPSAPKLIQTLVYVFVFNVGLAYTFILDDIEHALVFGGLIVGVLLVGSLAYAAVVWRGYSMSAYVIDLLYLFVAASLAVYVQGLLA